MNFSPDISYTLSKLKNCCRILESPMNAKCKFLLELLMGFKLREE